ncbi:MAG: sulfotransferase [Thermosynechococcaceae cyanobacterium]
MNLPNFLIIGAAKSGTTALHTYLEQHPQVYMTPEKETNFFAFDGVDLHFRGPGDSAINSFSITSAKDYAAQFANVTDETAIGEACPLYLYHPEAPARIQASIPDAKLLVILRSPVDRAHANFLHLVRDGREPHQDFAHALEDEQRRIQENWEWFWHYRQQGYYSAQLQRYCDRFSADQLKVYLYEDLTQSPETLLQDIFQYLEVDSSFMPDMTIRPNKSGMPKNRLMHRILTQPNPLKSMLKPLFPDHLRQKIQHQNLGKPQISPGVRQSLAALYQDDILRCQDLIQRDLSAWLATA